MATTERACENPLCGHGASAHKVRMSDGKPFRAECEFCDCGEYCDPMRLTGGATSYDSIRSMGQRSRYKIITMRTLEEQREYWRMRQRESRMRRRLYP